MITADFKNVTRNLIYIFKTYGKKERFNEGDIVFIRKERTDTLYLIERGVIRVYLPYSDGTERTLCYFSENTIIGEDAFTPPSERIVCTDSLTKTEVYKLSAKKLIQEASVNQHLITEILSYFMYKISLLHSWIFYAQFQKNEEKLACLLYTLSLSNTSVELSHHQMASVTGMSRITATKILNSFVKKGLVSVKYKKTKILDQENLRSIFKDKCFY